MKKGYEESNLPPIFATMQPLYLGNNTSYGHSYNGR